MHLQKEVATVLNGYKHSAFLIIILRQTPLNARVIFFCEVGSMGEWLKWWRELYHY